MKNFKTIAIHFVIALACIICYRYAHVLAYEFVTVEYTGKCTFYELLTLGMDAFDKVYRYGIGYYVCKILSCIFMFAGLVMDGYTLWETIILAVTEYKTEKMINEI